ncbi:MAG TPA: hybrid sensor histidine kinase/response regulator [Bacteroidales bacterium]|nr:hybrid sensor histidine kinase/response regulator [Bacteroidales bacterium]HRX97539.1 hybrid sensor histidine kinase/response regulator [Bacteroidales bacterium]
MDEQLNSILIVDDNKENIKVLGLALKEKEYNLTVAFSGPDALEILDATNIDLVLLDVMMPGMDGFEVCRRMKENENTREIPVIFITALTETNSIVKGFEVGGVDYLTKPFKKRELFARVDTQLKIKNQKLKLEEQKQELESTIKSRDTLYSIIAHDIRSPLANIKSVLSALHNDMIDQDSFQQLVAMLQITTSETYDLLENLLLWTKSKITALKPSIKMVEAKELIEKTVMVLQPSAEKKGISLTTELSKAGSITADSNMISTAVRNLVSNAIKFTQAGGEIKVICNTSSEETVIEVHDNGVGISEENIRKLLDAEEHFTTYGTDHEKGSGLGSKLVLGFIRSHGGQLSIESKPGKGSVFRISIPFITIEELVEIEE